MSEEDRGYFLNQRTSEAISRIREAEHAIIPTSEKQERVILALVRMVQNHEVRAAVYSTLPHLAVVEDR